MTDEPARRRVIFTIAVLGTVDASTSDVDLAATAFYLEHLVTDRPPMLVDGLTVQADYELGDA